MLKILNGYQGFERQVYKSEIYNFIQKKTRIKDSLTLATHLDYQENI